LDRSKIALRSLGACDGAFDARVDLSLGEARRELIDTAGVPACFLAH
jgi:hypothetical protein